MKYKTMIKNLNKKLKRKIFPGEKKITTKTSKNHASKQANHVRECKQPISTQPNQAWVEIAKTTFCQF